MHRGPLNRRVTGLHHSRLTAVQGEVDLPFDLDTDIKADGAMHRNRRFRWDINITHRGVCPDGDERGWVLQRGSICFDVHLVGEYSRTSRRDVDQSLDDTVKVFHH